MNKRRVIDVDKNSLKNIFKPENKKLKTNILTAFMIGILLIIVGNTFFENNHKQLQQVSKESQEKITEDSNIQYDKTERNLEKRLETIFSQVEGAGQLKVMVTMSCSSEIVVAQEVKKEQTTTEEQAQQGDVRKIQSEKSENKIVMAEDKDGKGTPLILKEEVPKIEGIVIVAQGGDNALVKDALVKAAQALLNLPAHKVQVLKMK